jgi:quercetin dioxygenase-like cupin family protein
METEFTKEIGIYFLQEQVMKQHQTPFPIIVQVVKGAVDFRVEGEIHQLKSGDIISLGKNVPHDLRAREESSIRLTLLKADSLSRVEDVAKD